nr:hypothetical protein [Brucella ceti]
MDAEHKAGFGLDPGACFAAVGQMKRLIDIFAEDDANVFKCDNRHPRLLVRIPKNVSGFLSKMRVKTNG